VSERFDELRSLIAQNDRQIVAAFNARLELVGELWRLKVELGLDRVDPERERALRDALRADNPGPLSDEGLDDLVSALLAVTKRELG
jgi:chorismate mutase